MHKGITLIFDEQIYLGAVNLPKDMDLKREEEEWHNWYAYYLSQKSKKPIQYENFFQQLIRHGAKEVEIKIYTFKDYS